MLCGALVIGFRGPTPFTHRWWRPLLRLMRSRSEVYLLQPLHTFRAFIIGRSLAVIWSVRQLSPRSGRRNFHKCIEHVVRADVLLKVTLAARAREWLWPVLYCVVGSFLLNGPMLLDRVRLAFLDDATCSFPLIPTDRRECFRFWIILHGVSLDICIFLYVHLISPFEASQIIFWKLFVLYGSLSSVRWSVPHALDSLRNDVMVNLFKLEVTPLVNLANCRFLWTFRVFKFLLKNLKARSCCQS